jgi:hypothetical protein
MVLVPIIINIAGAISGEPVMRLALEKNFMQEKNFMLDQVDGCLDDHFLIGLSDYFMCFSFFVHFSCSSGIWGRISVLMRVQFRTELSSDVLSGGGRCLFRRARSFRTTNSTPLRAIGRNCAP